MKSSLSRDEEIHNLHKRAFVFMGVIGFFLVIVLIRLFYLQVYQGEKYSLIADNISLRKVEDKAIRGRIFDRNGKLIAGNRNYFELSIIPQFVSDKEKTFESISRLTGIDLDYIKSRYQKYSYLPAFQPRPIIEDLSFNIAARVEEYFKPRYGHEEVANFQGVEVIRFQIRDYIYPEVFSHVMGYLKEIDQKTLEKMSAKYPDLYSARDLIGSSGLEKNYDLLLKGQNGIIAHIVDALGREVEANDSLELLRERSNRLAKEGVDIITTLDFKTQLKSYELLKGKRGAIVSMDPNTGEILSFVSSPGYNANRILVNLDKKYWQKINLDEERYLYNRVHQAAFPPASIYKIISTYAGLEYGLIDENTTHHCPGFYKYGNRRFKCWKHSGHGSLNVEQAMAKSCDVFFYKIATQLDVDSLFKIAEKFGLNQKTNIDIPFENSGHIPTKEWKKKRFGKPWIKSETLSLIIGQGYNLITPLQGARLISMTVNGGLPIQAHFFKEAKTQSGEVHSIWPKFKLFPVLDEVKLDLIKKGLRAVTRSGGTASSLKYSPYKIAGKTGTAQVIGHDSGKEKNKFTEDHAWFVGYAPYDKPQIAISVFVENGGGGSKVAAPIAKEVIETYLQENNEK